MRAAGAEMRERGIEVRLFGPFLLQPFRDHLKILVIDRRIAYSGGMNIADEYSGGSGGSSHGPRPHLAVDHLARKIGILV